MPIAYKLETAAGESWIGRMCKDKAAVREAGGVMEEADSCMLVGISTSSPCWGKPVERG